MTNAEAIKWLELQRSVGIQWDDDSEKHRPFREEAEKRISEAYSMAIDALREQEPRVLSLGEAIEGKNSLEIDPYVFVEIKGREDIFIGSVSDVTHYNHPDRKFSIRESFRIDRSFPASTVYSKTDYMKVARCWTHKPSKEQRKAVKWDD